MWKSGKDKLEESLGLVTLGRRATLGGSTSVLGDRFYKTWVKE
jgi:hypothetical protein